MDCSDRFVFLPSTISKSNTNERDGELTARQHRTRDASCECWRGRWRWRTKTGESLVRLARTFSRQTKRTYSPPVLSAASLFRFFILKISLQTGKKTSICPIFPKSPGVSPHITCTGYLPMSLPTRGRVIINTTAGELDIELWSRVRNRPYHWNLLRPEPRPRNVQRHAETSSRSPWRVSFRSPTSLFPLLIIPLRRDEVTMTGSYSTGTYPFPFHWKPRSGGAPVFPEQPKLILFFRVVKQYRPKLPRSDR